MLITLDNHTFLAEAASAASVQARRHGFDEKCRPATVLALAGSCAR
jgi:hypothetical protein